MNSLSERRNRDSKLEITEGPEGYRELRNRFATNWYRSLPCIVTICRWFKASREGEKERFETKTANLSLIRMGLSRFE